MADRTVETTAEEVPEIPEDVYKRQTVDVPSEYAGKAIEVFGSAGGEMTDMFQRGEATHLVFKIPSRGTMGLRTKLLNATRGEATMFHHFSEYGPYRGEFAGRKNGSMIAMSTEK